MKKRRKSGKRRLGPAVILFICLALLAVIALQFVSDLEVLPARIEQWFSDMLAGAERSGPTAGTLELHFIDVGQGDAIFITTASQNILVDGGERGDTVVKYLQSMGVKELDLVVGTHPHSDHIGGLVNVLKAIPVSEVIDPGVTHTTMVFEEYLTLIDEKGIKFTEARAGESRSYEDGMMLHILHPAEPPPANLNNASVVFKLVFGKVSFLLTGDVEAPGERKMLERRANLRSTVLKVSHHGGSTSTTPEFLDAVNPRAAVIMVGEGNSYGHPHQEVLELLHSIGVDIYRTDRHGTVVIVTDGETYEIYTEKGE